MQSLSHDRYLELRDGAEVIEADHHGDKVLRLRDGTILKLFRRKRLLSSAAWYPYAQRFADNARGLNERGIPAPAPLAVYRIKDIGRDAVHYAPLAGISLRQRIAIGLNDNAADALRFRLGAFVARLHRAGIYFRSLHFGNIIETPDGEFGLIDIADMIIRRRPLGPLLRRRNLAHLDRYDNEAAWLHAGHAFEEGYDRQ